MIGKPKPEPKQKKPPKPLKRSYIKAKPKGERRKFSQSERTLLEAELDKVCSEFVRKRDLACVTCGTDQELTCSHFYKRSIQFLRYDVKYNLNTQCLHCNGSHNQDRTAYTNYMRDKHGDNVLETLKKASTAIHFSWSVVDLREMLQRVKTKLSELKGES